MQLPYYGSSSQDSEPISGDQGGFAPENVDSLNHAIDRFILSGAKSAKERRTQGHYNDGPSVELHTTTYKTS